jgi:dCTP deaminase
MTAATGLREEQKTPGLSGGRIGILPSQQIRALIASGAIIGDSAIGDDQIQPASLDLRLGQVAYRVQASFLPGPDATVMDKIARLGMHEVALGGGAVLEKGCVYIVPLAERLALDERINGFANPKSSTGRLDVFTRLITDRGVRFDTVPAGYRGPLFAEVSPRTFSVLVRPGTRLAQLRLRRGSADVAPQALWRLHEEIGLIDAPLDRREVHEHGSVALCLDLAGGADGGPVGYKAKPHTGVIDLERIGGYAPADFWEPIAAHGRPGIILNPGDFYILATREAITVPPDHAAEMIAYDPLVGEFRVHYAGFFDPGFGFSAAGRRGSRAVLEVRSHDVPFLLEHGQIVGRLRYERLTEAPDRLYGPGIGSSYQGQGLALSKQFSQMV